MSGTERRADPKPDVMDDLQRCADALKTAPSPRVVDGPPAYWTWYDGPRKAALEAMGETP